MPSVQPVSLAVALWVGICLYLSLLDGTPRSYIFMLAGYTVALLGFPIVRAPQATFDIVVSRVQEIALCGVGARRWRCGPEST